MTVFQLLHPGWLTILVAVILAISLATGRAINPVGFLTPIIIGRSDHPRLYWTGIAILAFFVIGSWVYPN